MMGAFTRSDKGSDIQNTLDSVSWTRFPPPEGTLQVRPRERYPAVNSR